ncbi:DUF1993 domain-containing protein [Hyphococcus flavus]|uniref:DUF1993 domain-containing protein n=1 Tax=Hyphococcus flavus TaxID=1866326 RepID=A0AAE9ZCK6_9PROT|nr:DUF1993 domain-containing protein [Hyphococcus flavus]WDI30487.1 DUF1993 domain-containing protein [Hyphococcus flavus]
MTITISSSVLPAVGQMFDTLNIILEKAAERCAATDVEESTYLNWRMAPDMFPLAVQVRFATEIPARGLSRLAGAALPTFADDEISFSELNQRVDRARNIVEEIDREALDANPDKEITVPMGPADVTLKRLAFAHNWILPNLYFHTSASYLILRHLGLNIGKREFLAEMKPFIKT